MNREADKPVIADGKYVELKYQVIDVKTGAVLTGVDFPLGYVHGVNQVLSPAVMRELDGKAEGDLVEVPIDCNRLFGPRDESLVVHENIHNVPEEYRQVGTAILMENSAGKTRTFYVTRIAGDLITLDGNNPLCGREVLFRLQILKVREATEEERACGGKPEAALPDVAAGRAIPLH